jgi:hypothetical protein
MYRQLLSLVVTLFIMHIGTVAAAADPGAAGRLDFDDLQPTSPDAKTAEPLVFKDVSGTGVDVTIEGPALKIIDLYEFANVDDVRGNALITYIWPQEDGISVTFSKPVRRVGVVAGDFGGDADGPLVLRAFDCDGRELGRDSASWRVGQMPPFAPLKVSADSICQVLFTSGGEFAGSAFLDKLVFSVDHSK